MSTKNASDPAITLDPKDLRVPLKKNVVPILKKMAGALELELPEGLVKDEILAILEKHFDNHKAQLKTHELFGRYIKVSDKSPSDKVKNSVEKASLDNQVAKGTRIESSGALKTLEESGIPKDPPPVKPRKRAQKDDEGPAPATASESEGSSEDEDLPMEVSGLNLDSGAEAIGRSKGIKNVKGKHTVQVLIEEPNGVVRQWEVESRRGLEIECVHSRIQKKDVLSVDLRKWLPEILNTESPQRAQGRFSRPSDNFHEGMRNIGTVGAIRAGTASGFKLDNVARYEFDADIDSPISKLKLKLHVEPETSAVNPVVTTNAPAMATATMSAAVPTNVDKDENFAKLLRKALEIKDDDVHAPGDNIGQCLTRHRVREAAAKALDAPEYKRERGPGFKVPNNGDFPGYEGSVFTLSVLVSVLGIASGTASADAQLFKFINKELKALGKMGEWIKAGGYNEDYSDLTREDFKREVDERLVKKLGKPHFGNYTVVKGKKHKEESSEEETESEEEVTPVKKKAKKSGKKSGKGKGKYNSDNMDDSDA